MVLSGRGRAAVVLVAMLIGVAATANLGAWQLRRAAQKIALQDTLASRAQLPELGTADLAAGAEQAEAQHYRPVRLRGRWVPARTVFLENRQMRARVGTSVTLIGVGGIASGEDAYAKLRAGASLVQLYTALAFNGPSLVARIKRELLQCLSRDGFATVADVQSKLT